MTLVQDFIQSADFLTDSSDVWKSFVDALGKLKVQTKEEVEAGFSAFCVKLRESRIKGDTDEGVSMAKHCIKELMYWAEKFEFDSNQALVDVLRACYWKKLVPGQLVVAKSVTPYKYFESLEGQDLVDFIEIFKTDYMYQNGKDKSMELRYYEAASQKNRHTIDALCSNSENVKQAETANEAFAEAHMHNLKQIQVISHGKVATLHAELAKVFLHKFDRFRKSNTMYLKIPHLVKPHLEEFTKLVRDPKFPRHKGTLTEYEDWLRALAVVLVESPKEVTEVVPAFVNLMFSLALSENKLTRELSEIIAWQFSDAKKIIIKSVDIDCEILKDAAASPTKEAKKIVDIYMRYFITPSLKRADKVPTVLATFAQIIATSPDQKLMERIIQTIRDNNTVDIFKHNVDGIQKMMEAVLTVCRNFKIKTPIIPSDDSSDDDIDSEDEEDNPKQPYDEGKEKFYTLEISHEYLVRNLKSAKTLAQLNEYQMDVIIEAIQSNNHYLWSLSGNFGKFSEVPWQEKPEKFVEFLEGVAQCAESKMMMTEHGSELVATVVGQLDSGINAIKSEGLPLTPYIPAYSKLAKTVENRDLINEDEGITSDGQLLRAVLIFMSFEGHDISQLGYLTQLPFKFFDHSDSHIQGPAETLMHVFSRQPKSMLPHMDMIMDRTLKNKSNINLLTLLKAMLPLNLSLVSKKLDAVLECCMSTEAGVQMLWLDIVRQIAEEGTEAFSSIHIDGLKKCISEKYVAHTVFGILSIFAKNQPEILREHQPWMLEICLSNPDSIAYVMHIIPLLSTGKQDTMSTTVNKLMKLVDTFKPSEKVLVLICIRSLALQDKAVLQPHRSTYESLKSNRECAEVSQQLIDIAKGFTAKELGSGLADQKVAVAKVKKSLVKTKKNVGKMKVNMGKQDAKLEHATLDVKKAQKHVSELQSGMDEMGAKVDEIDHKTMTNAPDWSRDVSLLLNTPSEADWRLLAQRLGYSNNDIRAWACQADPCMAVLSEWYANHKAREATFGVMKALEEMHSEEALEIVKHAAEDAENVVTDTEVKVTNPPPVFLSYQWGHQDEAKLLKEHLEAAGFRCWLDLGQMGGGDKLFAKIDSGMRSAAVVICCVTHKYAKSDNCNREVNLAVTVGKPIIPLLMEKMSWPPEGAMGPIFGEYLFIRFFARPNETVSPPEVFWPQAKLKELLFQLRLHIIPEETLISKDYESWWLPTGQKPKPKIGSNDGTNKTVSNSVTSTKASTNQQSKPEASVTSESPQLFLSYQWGRQSEVEVLYNKLTRLGYTCWMDIHQMGGGDSLYDKIDRGIRGCCVAVSCVTPKYALSANCRKEMTLAEALKKPIIPLMLETMTWPPEGPMSMVLAPLAFIDCRAEVGAWNGPGAQNLLKQISKQMRPARSLGFPNFDEVDTSKKAFDAKKEWRKVKNVSAVVSTSQACHIL